MLESSSEKFANAIRRDFGEDFFIKLDGHDRHYITNSYHVPVFVPMNAFDKIEYESEYQPLSTGGHF